MKTKHLILSILSIPALIALFAYTSGPPAGHTGSPLDGQDCTVCHGPLPAGHLPGWITSDIPASGYVPGETYTITVTAVGLVAEKLGFQVTAETESSKAGEFIITDVARTQLTNATTVSHTTTGTVVTEIPENWSMDWVAPQAGSGEVTFYAAVNQTDNHNNNTGDLFYLSSLAVNEFQTYLPEILSVQDVHIYPNPSSRMITIKLPPYSMVVIYNGLGMKLIEQTVRNETVKLDVSAFEDGVYYASVLLDGQSVTRKIIKRDL